MNLNGNKITAIIFDLGGVILNIDLHEPFERLKTLLGVGLQQNGLHIIKNNDIFLRFEIGAISPVEFRNELRKISTKSFDDDEFDKVWNSIILDYPEDNVRFLENIKSRYRTFLMSNTNEIHYDYYSKTLNHHFGYKDLGELFEKAYYSHSSGMRKPNNNFFEYILKENDLKAENTLFIDDFAENIEAANKLGFNTIHLINGMRISDINLP
jgi:putative hydrolase of the HAD superfamily